MITVLELNDNRYLDKVHKVYLKRFGNCEYLRNVNRNSSLSVCFRCGQLVSVVLITSAAVLCICSLGLASLSCLFSL
jgi:hypothetical protein